jgi:phosphatidylethanolamine-binding protein (PEBP) family uncharacterized protein
MLMLVDPDAPTPDEPKFAFWRHWVLPGLQPLRDVEGVVGETRRALTEYLAPGPKDECVLFALRRFRQVLHQSLRLTCEKLSYSNNDYSSRPHRYLFLLFREPHGLSLSKEDVGGEEFVQRRSFDTATFITRHGLKLVGMNWMLGAGDGWQG